MAGVIDLAAWRREHGGGPGQERLDQAIDHLEGVLTDGRWDPPPSWLVTELLAIQGCLSVGMVEDAAWRAERLALRADRIVHRPRRARAR
jgi:hypothetical protein